MVYQTLATAKLEIGVFLLAACVHFLLFSNQAPARSSLKRREGKTAGSGAPRKTANVAASIAQALREPLRTKNVEKALIQEELEGLLAYHEVPEEETQAVLASSLEGPDGVGRGTILPEVVKHDETDMERPTSLFMFALRPWAPGGSDCSPGRFPGGGRTYRQPSVGGAAVAGLLEFAGWTRAQIIPH